MSVKMVSTSTNLDWEQFDYEDPSQAWAQRKEAQWELRFEQHEPPREDQIIQMNIGDAKNSKPIFVSRNLD